MSTIVLHRQRHVSVKMPGGWSRKQWREVAVGLGVPRGRDTADTIRNIKAKLIEFKSRRIIVKTAWAEYLYSRMA